MREIVEINRQRFFTLEDANALLPLIYRLTEEASREMKKLVQCLETLPDKTSDRAVEVEARVDALIEKWQSKLSRLGVQPKGLWLADFDNGDGYWCWKFPETEVQHYHGYQDGFSGRRPIHHLNGTSEQHESRHRANQSNSWGLQGE